MANNTQKRAKTRKERLEARAQAEREALLAARRERQIQTAIGAVVVAVLVVVLGVVAYFVGRNIYESNRSSEQANAQAYEAVQAVKVKPKNAAADGGFILSKDGVNKPVNDVPTIDNYMDFICPACGVLARSIDEDLTAMMNAGQVNISIHPSAFLNSASSDKYSTRSAAFVSYVADNDPEHAMPLIEAMFATTFQPSEGSAYKSVSNDDLTKLAESVGVDSTIARDAAKGTYEPWVEAVSNWYPTNSSLLNPSGSLKGQMTTPTILINKNYWDYNTLMSQAKSNDYSSVLLESIGMLRNDIGNPSIKPSIGVGTPRDITAEATSSSN
ncbi:hypothetical protein EJ419_04360 [Alloscardovia theropitheci]|uniref:Thioredoxin-like fold domain-containing protein n=1 Tax=Alloscardovia theropitheci TaxID=2496842 RepID=A0A4R0QVM4_9BIFI|nr:thioredoxin domain-containing protein [Alloscardovia theropitheci]TCD54277.1 hypothetical protein EJ419_04360 [Alloscardovia theropitheci]